MSLETLLAGKEEDSEEFLAVLTKHVPGPEQFTSDSPDGPFSDAGKVPSDLSPGEESACARSFSYIARLTYARALGRGLSEAENVYSKMGRDMIVESDYYGSSKVKVRYGNAMKTVGRYADRLPAESFYEDVWFLAQLERVCMGEIMDNEEVFAPPRAEALALLNSMHRTLVERRIVGVLSADDDIRLRPELLFGRIMGGASADLIANGEMTIFDAAPRLDGEAERLRLWALYMLYLMERDTPESEMPMLKGLAVYRARSGFTDVYKVKGLPDRNAVDCLEELSPLVKKRFKARYGKYRS